MDARTLGRGIRNVAGPGRSLIMIKGLWARTTPCKKKLKKAVGYSLTVIRDRRGRKCGRDVGKRWERNSSRELNNKGGGES